MDKNKYIGTWIDGIGSTTDLDSSGERIDQKGIDTSSLTQDGVLNFEHKSDNSLQIVGKILEAKTILKKEDCENDRHKHFWELAGEQAYLYIAGVLFDELGHPGAQSIAAMLKFDTLTKKDKTKNVIGFSIEGSRLDKDGVWIKKCIARKMTITNHPCNKRCVAELYEDPSKSSGIKLLKEDKESLLDVFKKSEEAGCELNKAEKKYYTSLYSKKPKESPTRSFVPQPKGATQQRSGSNALQNKAGSLPEPKVKVDASNIKDNQKLDTGTKITYRPKKPITGAKLYNDPNFWSAPNDKPFKKSKLGKYDSNMRKALVASAGMGAPSAKVGGDALVPEHIEPKMQDATKFKGDEKRRVNIQNKQKRQQKKDIWNNFGKKEELISFLDKKYPELDEKLKKHIAINLAYRITKKQEKILKDLTKAKIDDVKYPEGSKKAASKKKKDRAERKKGYKPHVKERSAEQRTRRALITDPKTSEENLNRLKRKVPKIPKKKDLEYPLAASENVENDLNKSYVKAKEDHPFKVGDRVHQDEKKGTVTQIASRKVSQGDPKEKKFKFAHHIKVKHDENQSLDGRPEGGKWDMWHHASYYKPVTEESHEKK